MKTLLVTGASGFLGGNICQRAKSDWTIFGTVYSHSAKIPGVDEFRTPLSGENAVEGLMIALERLPDVIHLGGVERISRYEFGKLVMDVFNFRNAKFNPCKQQEIQMAAPRPRDVSLTNAKAMQMGFQPDPVKLSLERIKAVGNEKV